MNLNKYIRMSLINLSTKYKITLIELTVAKEQKISKTYRLLYETIDEKMAPIKEEFKNKRDLARWLMCLQ